MVLNTIIANMRTEELLQQSQSLNAELEQQAQLLEERNLDIEGKNREIELARLGLEEKASQLALSSRYKSEFLANMSHELRTPLNSLLILSKLLLDNEAGNLTEKQLDFARTIRAAGSDLLELINDILDLSKIEAGKMDLLFDAIPRRRGLRLRAADVRAGGRRQGAHARRRARRRRARGDRHRRAAPPADPAQPALQRVQVHRGGRGHAAIERAAEDAVTFSVIDTGIGIAADKLAVIFEAFQQADGTTSRTYGGTGLGLSISRELARALGGEISVQSTVEQGSTFTLTPAPGRGARRHRRLAGVAGYPRRRCRRPPTASPAPRTNGERGGRRRRRRGTAGGRTAGPSPPTRRLLVLDRGGLALHAIRGLVGRDHGVELTSTQETEEALAVIDASLPDCLVIGSRLSKTVGVRAARRAARPRRRSSACRSSCAWTGA